MSDGPLPEDRANHRIGPQRTKRPGNRFQPYGAGRLPAERRARVLNPELESLQLPRQDEAGSRILSEPHDDDEGYDSDPIEPYDVTWNQKAAATANLSDYGKWDTAPAEFIRSSSGLGSGWVGKRPLGSGAFGVAGLWEKRDNNGSVMEVRKAHSMRLMVILTVSKANRDQTNGGLQRDMEAGNANGG